MSAGRIVLGLSLVTFGTLALLDATGAADGSAIAADWWPIVFVALGVVQVVIERRIRVASMVLLVGGSLALLASTNTLTGSTSGIVWPLLLIAVGVWLVIGRPWIGTPLESDRPFHVAVLTVSRLSATSRNLQSADVTSILSSVRLDLSKALPIAGGASIGATAVLGSIDLVVPEGWRVEVRGIPILGGWDDTTSRERIDAEAPVLRVRALVVLGGVDVRHKRRWS